MPHETLENQLAHDLTAIPQLSTPARRDILACPWDVLRALSRHAQRVEDDLRERLREHKDEGRHDDTA